MKLSAPTIAIFDMDGTTVRHMHPWVLNFMETVDDILYKIRCFIMKTFGFSAKDPFMGVLNKGEFKQQRLLVHRAIHFLRRKEVDQIVEPCPLINEVLKILQSNGVMMGIASNGLGKGYGHDILKKFDLEKYFQVSVFREDIQKAKPHPEAIIRAIESLSRKVTSHDVIWYIGDRWKDMQAALAARDLLPCKILPFAYGPNASLHAFIDGKLSSEQRILSYEDMLVQLRSVFKP